MMKNYTRNELNEALTNSALPRQKYSPFSEIFVFFVSCSVDIV